MTGAVQAGIRAIDAIWPDDLGIRMALTGGVTTANIMPGSGNVIGGQTLYVKLRPGPITNMMVQPGVLVHPRMQRPASPETFKSSLNNAGMLPKRNIPMAIASGYRNLRGESPHRSQVG